MSKNDALEVDDVFFSLLAPKHLLLELIQAKAFAKNGNLEGEASQGIWSHHLFKNFHPDDLSKPSNSKPHVQELSSLDDSDSGKQAHRELNQPSLCAINQTSHSHLPVDTKMAKLMTKSLDLWPDWL